MKSTLGFVIAAGICFLGAVQAKAENNRLPVAQNGAFAFSHFLRYRPLDLDLLLGKHFSQVLPPGVAWERLYVAPEFKDPAIKYGVFVQNKDLKEYMDGWDFIRPGRYCLSNYSMFIMYFNAGYVFRVQLRYFGDSFRGTRDAKDPEFCDDNRPIFEMIARRLGGTVFVRQASRELIDYNNRYTLKLGTGGDKTTLTWHLRGSPSLPGF